MSTWSTEELLATIRTVEQRPLYKFDGFVPKRTQTNVSRFVDVFCYLRIADVKISIKLIHKIFKKCFTTS